MGLTVFWSGENMRKAWYDGQGNLTKRLCQPRYNKPDYMLHFFWFTISFPPRRNTDVDEMVNCLVKEVEYFVDKYQIQKIKSVYFGGGKDFIW